MASPQAQAADVLYTRRPRAAVAAVVALGAASFCFVSTENLPVGLLPVIARSLHSTVSATGLLVTVYALVVVVVSAPLAHWSKGVPRRLLVCGLLGAFVLGCLASAAATSYWLLLGARVFTAMAQALFWAVAPVAGVGLFPPALRARAVTGVLGGGSFAVVLGVPLGTWLGQQGGWRLPFLVLSGVAAICLVAVAVLLPTADPAHSHAAAGAQPDRRRFYVLVATTVLVVGGMFTAYTYVSPFLTRVAGMAPHDVAGVLLVTGLASTLGVMSTGLLFDRLPRAATLGPFVLVSAGLLGLWVFGRSPFAAVVAMSLTCTGLGCFVISNQNRVLIVAPGSSDVASAWASASFNVGIAGGSLAGSLVVPAFGVGATPLVGGILATGALALIVAGWELGPTPKAVPAPKAVEV